MRKIEISILTVIFLMLSIFCGCNNAHNSDIINTDLKLVSSFPCPNEKVKCNFSSISLVFSDELAENIGGSDIVLTDLSDSTESLLSPSVNGNVVLLQKYTKLKPFNKYELEIIKGTFFSKFGQANDHIKLEFETLEINDDNTSPVLIQNYPQNNSEYFSVGDNIILMFDEEIRKGIDFNDISIKELQNEVKYQITVDGSQIEIEAELEYEKIYTLTIPKNGVMDYYGNYLNDEVIIVFSTASELNNELVKPVDIVTTIPQNDFSDVPVSSPIKVIFNTNIQQGNNYENIEILNSDGKNVLLNKKINSSQLSFIADLDYDCEYYVILPNNSIYNFDKKCTFRFHTKKKQIYDNDNNPPLLRFSSLQDGQKDISSDTKTINLLFDENIRKSDSFFNINLISNTLGETEIQTSVTENVLTISLSEQLSDGVEYVLTIPCNAISDMLGNKNIDKYVITFVTKEVSEFSQGGANQATVSIPKTIDFAGKKYNSEVSEISVSNKKIDNLEVLSEFKNLKKLELIEVGITDISFLQGLQNLEYLNLKMNSIKDISAIAKLTKLKYLNLQLNEIADIKPLKNLVKLSELILSNNSINDISPIEMLNSIEVLDITDNMISDISKLSKLSKLRNLNAEFNSISDITVLAKLKCLEELYLSVNNISDVSALAENTDLVKLYLSSNDIKNAEALKSLKKLKILILSDNYVQIDELQVSLPNCNIVL